MDNERLWLKTEGDGAPSHAQRQHPLRRGPGRSCILRAEDRRADLERYRQFTLATNQVDFAQPGRFDLTFTNRDGVEETPLCIHRAPLSTHERMIGFLIEHYAGNFPVWLAPRQVVIIPITDAHHEYAVQLEGRLKAAGIRAEADLSSDRMNAKIRNAQLMKAPYMLVAGDQEIANETVSLRRRDGEPMPTLVECIERERELMAAMQDVGISLDTSDLHPNVLRKWVREVAGTDRAWLTILSPLSSLI